MEHVVIVGASAAGSITARTLRREGFTGAITLLGDEPHLPYDRPPLSKEVLLGTMPLERVHHATSTTYSEQGIDLRLNARAERLSLDKRLVELATGEQLAYDRLVIATGVQPLQLSHGHDLPGVHVLRTLDDALALREALLQASSVVVVGAGFLGSETAAAARQLGCDVTLVDLAPAPMARQLGADLGSLVADLHAANGVRVVGGTGARIRGTAAAEGVELDDGTAVKADVVLVAVGSRPATGWLESSGLPLDDGVLAEQAPAEVYAAGDVARWTSRRFGLSLRLEHRFNATEQAVDAARQIAGKELPPFDPIPYFWTDQYDTKIQVYGVIPPDAELVIAQGDPADGKFIAHYRSAGHLTAVLGWNLPRELRAARALLTATDTHY